MLMVKNDVVLSLCHVHHQKCLMRFHFWRITFTNDKDYGRDDEPPWPQFAPPHPTPPVPDGLPRHIPVNPIDCTATFI